MDVEGAARRGLVVASLVLAGSSRGGRVSLAHDGLDHRGEGRSSEREPVSTGNRDEPDPPGPDPREFGRPTAPPDAGAGQGVYEPSDPARRRRARESPPDPTDLPLRRHGVS